MIKTALSVLTLSVTVGLAQAGEQQSKNMGKQTMSSASETSEMRFRTLDTDGNSHISLPEAQGRHRIFYYLQKADLNSDGHIDLTEFSRFESENPWFEDPGSDTAVGQRQ